MQQLKHSERAALMVIRWVGSTRSIAAHTALFILCFVAVYAGLIALDTMLLALTTVVSLEAIYLAIFIQMTVNLQSESIEEVEKDIDEIQEDIGELQENVEDISEDVEEMSEEETAESRRKQEQKQVLVTIQNDLRKLMQDIEKLQSRQ
jgi:peptidoglycan hydrolase CwlO-like protein